MRISSEELVQTIFQKCAGTSGCEVCRPHMEDDCLFFPELYRLQDKFIDKGKPLASKSVNKLIDLCTLCGLCPCPDVRMLILKTKATLADEKGLPLSSRLIADAQKAGKLGGVLNNTANFISSNKATSSCFKKTLKVPLGSGSGRFISLPKKIYRKILKDDGYFSSINPLDRIN